MLQSFNIYNSIISTDILLRNPRGFGRQVILDVAVTAVDGQSRTSDDVADRPLNVRYDQKMAKYHRLADQSGFHFVRLFFRTLVKFISPLNA